MKLKDILTEVDLLVDNALSLEQKIGFINQIQRQLYRDYPLPAVTYLFYTIRDQTLYDLPEDCKEDRIIALFVDSQEYEYKTQTDFNHYKSFTVLNGMLFIQPTPKLSAEAYLNYYASPTDLTITDMENEPKFPDDYHEILVLGCAKKVALIAKEYKVAEQLEIRYQTLAREADVKLSQPKLRRVRVMRGWS